MGNLIFIPFEETVWGNSRNLFKLLSYFESYYSKTIVQLKRAKSRPVFEIQIRCKNRILLPHNANVATLTPK